MNYKVLYRKYRPSNFETIIGQDYIVKTLKNSIINNHISHAYIFSGPRGTGKTSTAKVFAKAINCQNPINGSPCEKCEFCNNFRENTDIIEIDAASNNGVDEIRNLIDNIKLTPSNGKYKVYIIDEVHMLTVSAFNALLLTLEEPPAHAIFILATTNIENVPITILSRCQRFDFQKITIDEISNNLSNICKNEKITIDDDAIKEIAYLSDGGMRDALSILDQLSKSNEKITLEFVEKQIKTISKKNIENILDIIEDNNIDKFLEYINDFRIRGVNYKTLVKKIIDGLSIKAINLKKNIIKSRLSFNDYKNIIICLSDSLIKVSINIDSYTILEMSLLDYFSTESNNNNSNKKEEKNYDVVLLNNENDSNILEFKKIRINNCFVDAKKEYLENSKVVIDNLRNNIDIDGKIRSILLDSVVVASSNKYMILTCNNSHIVENANNNIKIIERCLKNSIDSDYKLLFLSNEEWQNAKNDYVNSLKNGKKYNYIEENNSDESKNVEVSDVFDLNKVEIV